MCSFMKSTTVSAGLAAVALASATSSGVSGLKLSVKVRTEEVSFEERLRKADANLASQYRLRSPEDLLKRAQSEAKGTVRGKSVLKFLSDLNDMNKASSELSPSWIKAKMDLQNINSNADSGVSFWSLIQASIFFLVPKLQIEIMKNRAMRGTYGYGFESEHSQLIGEYKNHLNFLEGVLTKVVKSLPDPLLYDLVLSKVKSLEIKLLEILVVAPEHVSFSMDPLDIIAHVFAQKIGEKVYRECFGLSNDWLDIEGKMIKNIWRSLRDAGESPDAKYYKSLLFRVKLTDDEKAAASTIMTLPESMMNNVNDDESSAHQEKVKDGDDNEDDALITEELHRIHQTAASETEVTESMIRSVEEALESEEAAKLKEEKRVAADEGAHREDTDALDDDEAMEEMERLIDEQTLKNRDRILTEATPARSKLQPIDINVARAFQGAWEKVNAIGSDAVSSNDEAERRELSEEALHDEDVSLQQTEENMEVPVGNAGRVVAVESPNSIMASTGSHSHNDGDSVEADDLKPSNRPSVPFGFPSIDESVDGKNHDQDRPHSTRSKSKARPGAPANYLLNFTTPGHVHQHHRARAHGGWGASSLNASGNAPSSNMGRRTRGGGRGGQRRPQNPVSGKKDVAPTPTWSDA